MSILIKGMKMPKECLECPMCDSNDDCVLQKDKRFDTWEEQRRGCPLVEIPVHGRLIDADALKETLDYYICEANWGDEVNKGLRWVKDEFITSENTVIEAEGSEDE